MKTITVTNESLQLFCSEYLPAYDKRESDPYSPGYIYSKPEFFIRADKEIKAGNEVLFLIDETGSKTGRSSRANIYFIAHEHDSLVLKLVRL